MTNEEAIQLIDEKECGKEILYVDDIECMAQAESEETDERGCEEVES